MEYGIAFDFDVTVSDKEKAEAIKKAGFTHTFLWRYKTPGAREKLCEQARLSREAGLIIETVHAEYKGVNDMWRLFKGNDMFSFFMDCVDDCAALKIPILVVHVSSGNYPPVPNGVGLGRYAALCKEAKEKGVIIAFENLRKRKYLNYVLPELIDMGARFCFDCGHENIYDKGIGIFEKYKDYLVCVHLHDNYGKRDDHLLPFDGKIDWRALTKRLESAPRCVVTLEVFTASYKEKQSIDEFLSKAYQSALRILQ